jgi:alkylated DNA repair protein (DNA oxidative demethylase)
MGTLELPFGDHTALPDRLVWLKGAVDLAGQGRLRAALTQVLEAAPPAQHRTKGGGMTSAAMTNCGQTGWISDAKGYRYTALNPATGRAWPRFPAEFDDIIQMVTAESAWPGFTPDACLINFYGPDAKMGLHQDKDEADFSQPIITVCLGDDADFLIGGFARADKARAIVVKSGDVLLMGGASRMRFHGIRKIYPGTSPLPEIKGRYSLTFRKAL